MIRRPPRSTQSRSSAASDVYKRQAQCPLTYCKNAQIVNASKVFYAERFIMHISHQIPQFHNPHITVLKFATSNSPLRKEEVQLLQQVQYHFTTAEKTIHSDAERRYTTDNQLGLGARALDAGAGEAVVHCNALIMARSDCSAAHGARRSWLGSEHISLRHSA